MTEQDVENVITDCASRGIKIDHYHAKFYLGVNELLAASPNDARLRRVAAKYSALTTQGIHPQGFEKFLINDCEPFRTDEEVAEMRSRGCRYV